jgi:transcriptional regulator with GAF, ATPase, and Fis domain
MGFDYNDFFKQAIMRISGSLEIEKALYDAYLYLKEFIPLDHLMLMHPDFEGGFMRVVATANDDGGYLDGRCWELPPEIMSRVRSNQVPEVMLINHPETHFLAKHSLALGSAGSSLIVVRLLVGGQLVGSLTLRVLGHNRYTEEHAELMSSLREPFAIALSNTLRYQELLKLKERLADDSRFFQGELLKMVGEQIVGSEFGLKGVMDLVRQVAPMESPVLLLGETGTGKEVIAGALHNLSPRQQGPFVRVNCGAIHPTLLDSELFGYEKGAFTGAIANKRGLFERASGGTIFLDEVGELTPEAQVRLLRVLQEKEIERVGGDRTIGVDARVLAATNRDLESLAQEGRFRQDLYFRLMVFPILIPPLRERISDIPALVQHFIQKKVRIMGITKSPELAPGTLDRLMAYGWPGNVRELENTVERAIILSQGAPLAFDMARPSYQPSQGIGEAPAEQGPWKLDQVVSRHIKKALAVCRGRVGGKGGAAKLLGMNPSTLRARMRKLGIPFGRKAA